jgi:hypothetical protein
MVKLFKENIISYAFVIILCIPLLFINIKDSHDWGDDFAQYIHQAINITKGIPQSDIGVIDDGDGPGVHVSTRPVGFPLILAPVYSLFGNSIKAFSITISFILILLCLVLFIYFNKNFNILSSLLLVLIFAYNPFTLNFKMEIMSDIPFTLFLISSILIYSIKEGNKLVKYLITGIFIAILISIRTIGVVLLAAIIIDDLRKLYINRGNKNETMEIVKGLSLIITIVFLITFRTINFAYFSSISLGNSLGMLGTKLGYYIQMFQNYFMSGGGRFPLFAKFTQWFIIIFTVVGLLMKWLAGIDFIDIFIFIYFIVLLFYPDMHSGMRFLFPIFPLLFYYTVFGLRMIPVRSLIMQFVVTLSLGLFILIPYSFSLSNSIQHQHETLQGPQEKESVEAFDYIKNNLPADGIIAFNKPRVLALYTDRQVYAFRKKSPNDMAERFKGKNGIYLLTCTELPDESIDSAIINYPEQVNLIWSNAKFKLYSLK